jgi:hypothetical protein
MDFDRLNESNKKAKQEEGEAVLGYTPTWLLRLIVAPSFALTWRKEDGVWLPVTAESS